jgi:hypothetical protein
MRAAYARSAPALLALVGVPVLVMAIHLATRAVLGTEALGRTFGPFTLVAVLPM